MVNGHKSRLGGVGRPGGEAVVAAVAVPIPAFLIGSSRVGAEEDSAILQARIELLKNSRKVLAWDVEESGVGEDTVELLVCNLEFEKILMEDLTARVGSGHAAEVLAAIESCRMVSTGSKIGQIASRSAA